MSEREDIDDMSAEGSEDMDAMSIEDDPGSIQTEELGNCYDVYFDIGRQVKGRDEVEVESYSVKDKYDNVLKMVNGVCRQDDINSIVSLELHPAKMKRQLIRPFLKIFRSSTTLNKLALGYYGNYGDRTPFDRIYKAAIRNPKNPITNIEVYKVGGTMDLFAKFVASCPIEKFTVNFSNEAAPRLSCDIASSLVACLQTSNNLTKLDLIILGFDDQAIHLLLVGLIGHPALEDFRLIVHNSLDQITYHALLSICAACPKITQFEVRNFYSRANKVDVTNLLHGLRLSKSLKSLLLDVICLRGNVAVHFFPTNDTLEDLDIHCSTFRKKSLSILSRFIALKRLSFFECLGVGRVADEALGHMKSLQELKILVCAEDRDHFVSKIAQIFEFGPSTIKLDGIITTNAIIDKIVQGLENRKAPLNALHFQWTHKEGVLHYFSENVIRRLLDLEDISIYWHHPYETSELMYYLDVLASLKKLKTIDLGFETVKKKETCEKLLKLMKTNHAITSLTFYVDLENLKIAVDIAEKGATEGEKTYCPFTSVGIPVDVENMKEVIKTEAQITVYETLNRCGRAHIFSSDVPIYLWPHFLSKFSRAENTTVSVTHCGPRPVDRIRSVANRDILYHFVKDLNAAKSIFRNAK